MKLEDQVTSLELSKHLKQLGVKQDGLFFYHKQKFGNYLLGNSPDYHDFLGGEHYSAFTASELLELLPHIIRLKNKNNNLLNMSKHEIYYYDIYSHGRLVRFNNETFVNLLAKMLIHLIENNLLEIK
jgi:hypothetical protein